MPVTIKTIAEKTGLSLGTVSQALRDSGQTSEKTRKRVRAAAEKLGYVPSDIGRALQAGKSSFIGYFLADITMTYYVDIMQGLASAASENGYGILFVSPSFDPEEQIRQIKFLEKKRVEGIITSGCEPETWRYLEKLHERGFPIVVSENIAPTKITTVKTDDFEGGRMAAAHFYGLGHKKMLYFNSKALFNLRLDGFQHELKQCGLSPAIECWSKDQLFTILKTNDRPTAVFAYGDLDAMLVRTVAAELNLGIPEDLSLIGFDDCVYSSFPEITLTTLKPQKQEIGRKSFQMLLKMIRGENIENCVLFKPELIIRKSTAQLHARRKMA